MSVVNEHNLDDDKVCVNTANPREFPFVGHGYDVTIDHVTPISVYATRDITCKERSYDGRSKIYVWVKLLPNSYHDAYYKCAQYMAKTKVHNWSYMYAYCILKTFACTAPVLSHLAPSKPKNCLFQHSPAYACLIIAACVLVTDVGII